MTFISAAADDRRIGFVSVTQNFDTVHSIFLKFTVPGPFLIGPFRIKAPMVGNAVCTKSPKHRRHRETMCHHGRYDRCPYLGVATFRPRSNIGGAVSPHFWTGGSIEAGKPSLRAAGVPVSGRSAFPHIVMFSGAAFSHGDSCHGSGAALNSYYLSPGV